MTTYKYTRQHSRDTVEQEIPSEQESRVPFPEDPIARAAYEWNHALKIAAEKIWGRE